MSASEQDRARSIHGGTRTLGVIGWPVEHSLSPAIHNAAFRSMGLPWVYLPLPVAPGTLPQALAGLVALGFEGANITMPHKTEAADLADELTEDARLLGAANTLTVQNGAILGDNTDAPGFERFLRTDAGFDARGTRALLFGAGGAARAVALALARSGVAALTVAAREPATAMADRGTPRRVRGRGSCDPARGGHRIRGGSGRQRHPRGRRRGRDASRSGPGSHGARGRPAVPAR